MASSGDHWLVVVFIAIGCVTNNPFVTMTTVCTQVVTRAILDVILCRCTMSSVTSTDLEQYRFAEFFSVNDLNSYCLLRYTVST